MILTTETGRNLRVEHDLYWPRGRVIYTVAGVGTFTLGWGYSAGQEKPHLWYGRVTAGWVSGYREEPEEPSVYGIQLHGGSVFNLESYDRRHNLRHEGWTHTLPPHNWIATPRRSTGWATSTSVPAGTHKRAADIAGALVEHWRDLDEFTPLHLRYMSSEAPGRIAERLRIIHNLRNRIADDCHDLAKADTEIAQLRATILSGTHEADQLATYDAELAELTDGLDADLAMDPQSANGHRPAIAPVTTTAAQAIDRILTEQALEKHP